MPQYHVKIPIRGSFIGSKGLDLLVAVPARAMLTHLPGTPQLSAGRTNVRWDGREYSISEADLYQKCARVSAVDCTV